LKITGTTKLKVSDHYVLLPDFPKADGDAKEDFDRYIIFTTARCYENRIRNKIGHLYQPPSVAYGKQGKTRLPKAVWQRQFLVWGRAIKDEAHLEWSHDAFIPEGICSVEHVPTTYFLIHRIPT